MSYAYSNVPQEQQGQVYGRQSYGENRYYYSDERERQSTQPKPCTFCFGFHNQSEQVPNFPCPKIFEQMKKLREQENQRTKIICKNCSNGKLKKFVQQVVYQESKEQYLERIQKFDNSVREEWICKKIEQKGDLDNLRMEMQWIEKGDYKEQVQYKKYPRRRIKTVIIQEVGVKCLVCKGKGFIERIQKCECDSGCYKCRDSGAIQSQTYKKEKIKNKLVGKPLDSKEENCIICLSVFQQREKCVKLQCLHYFHKDCLEKWLQKSPKCPICRCEDKELKQYFRLFPKGIDEDIIPTTYRKRKPLGQLYNDNLRQVMEKNARLVSHGMNLSRNNNQHVRNSHPNNNTGNIFRDNPSGILNNNSHQRSHDNNIFARGYNTRSISYGSNNIFSQRQATEVQNTGIFTNNNLRNQTNNNQRALQRSSNPVSITGGNNIFDNSSNRSNIFDTGISLFNGNVVSNMNAHNTNNQNQSTNIFGNRPNIFENRRTETSNNANTNNQGANIFENRRTETSISSNEQRSSNPVSITRGNNIFDNSSNRSNIFDTGNIFDRNVISNNANTTTNNTNNQSTNIFQNRPTETSISSSEQRQE